MLVLSRKGGESVYIGPGIHVKVLAIRGGTVKLGFEAPPEVAIHREEVQRTVESAAPRAPRKRSPNAICLAGVS
jgi:carbon storage regulator